MVAYEPTLRHLRAGEDAACCRWNSRRVSLGTLIFWPFCAKALALHLVIAAQYAKSCAANHNICQLQGHTNPDAVLTVKNTSRSRRNGWPANGFNWNLFRRSYRRESKCSICSFEVRGCLLLPISLANLVRMSCTALRTPYCSKTKDTRKKSTQTKRRAISTQRKRVSCAIYRICLIGSDTTKQ